LYKSILGASPSKVLEFFLFLIGMELEQGQLERGYTRWLAGFMQDITQHHWTGRTTIDSIFFTLY